MNGLTRYLKLKDRMSRALVSPIEKLTVLNDKLETIAGNTAFETSQVQIENFQTALSHVDMSPLTDGITLDFWQIDNLKDLLAAVLTAKALTLHEALIKAAQGAHDLQTNLLATNRTIIDKQKALDTANKKQGLFNRFVAKGTGLVGKLGGQLKKIAVKGMPFLGLQQGLQQQFQTWLGAVTQRQAVEIPLMVSMRNVGASRDEVQAFINETQQLQDRFAFSDTLFMAGAIELARVVSDTSYINELTTALADMTAGIAGINATETDMTHLAGGLAQALDGNYSRLESKGVILSEGQRQILRYGTELERITVINEAVERSFGGMAEALANTPEGKLLRIRHAVEDVHLSIGQQLQPAWMHIVGLFYAHLPYIEMLLMGIGNAAIAVTNWFASTVFPVLLNGFSMVVTTASWVSDMISNNWGIIEPIIWGIVAALAAQKAITIALATKKVLLAAKTKIMTIAQLGLNKAMMANPIGLVIGLIALLVAGIVHWVQSVGGLRVAWLITMDVIMNTWDFVSNALIAGFNQQADSLAKWQMVFRTVGVAIANYMGDMLVNVLSVLDHMINGAIDRINKFIEIINHLPIISIDTIQHVSFATGAALEEEARRYERELNLAVQRQEMYDGIQARADTLQNRRDNQVLARDERQLGIEQARYDAYNRINLESPVPFDPFDNMVTLMDSHYHDYHDMLGYTTDIAGNTGDMARAVNIADEDLRHFRDVAVREATNNVTYTVNPTFSINIQATNEIDITTAVKEAVDEVMDEYGWNDDGLSDGLPGFAY